MSEYDEAAHDLRAADPRAPADVTALRQGLPQIATMAAAPPPPVPEPEQPAAGGTHVPQEQGSRTRARGGAGHQPGTGQAAEPGGS